MIKNLFRKIFKLPPIYKPIKYGLRFVVGDIGSGKSSFMAVNCNLQHNDPRFKKDCEKELEILHNVGFKNLKMPETLIFSDTTVKLLNNFNNKEINYKLDDNLKENTLYTNSFDPYKFFIANDVVMQDIFPPNSCFHLDEGQQIYNNRASASFPEIVEGIYYRIRHLKFNMYIYFQQKEGVDLKLRDAVCEIYYLKEPIKINYYLKKSDSKGNRQIKSVKWKFLVYTKFQSFLDDVEPLDWLCRIYLKYELFKKKLLLPFCFFSRLEKINEIREIKEMLRINKTVKYKKIKYKGNPFDLYDSFQFGYANYLNYNCKNLQEYINWAKEVQFDIRSGYMYSYLMSDIYKFGEEHKFVKPNWFTKLATARKIVEKEKKSY